MLLQVKKSIVTVINFIATYMHVILAYLQSDLWLNILHNDFDLVTTPMNETSI